MRSRPTALTVPILTVLLLLAACGGGGGDGDGVASLSGSHGGDGEATSTTLSEEEAEEAMLEWAACMREQGIDVPDPQVDGNGRTSMIIGRSSEDDDGDDDADGGARTAPMDREDFEAARDECGDPPMFGRELSEEDRKEMEANALEFAECMRENGLDDFPDPDFSTRGPGAGPGTRVERFDDDDDADGEASTNIVGGPFGEIDLDDPEAQAAFETCSDDVGFGPGGRGGRPAIAVAPAGGSS